MPDTRSNAPGKTRNKYSNWDDFKIALEVRMGRPLPLIWWLHIKPQKPLPWDEADLLKSLAEVLRIQETFNYKPTRFCVDWEASPNRTQEKD